MPIKSQASSATHPSRAEIASYGGEKWTSISGPASLVTVRASPGGSCESERNIRIASIRLVLPLPLGPMTRLKGASVRLVARSALKFRKAIEAITAGR